MSTASGDRQPATGDQQPATGNRQPATGKQSAFTARVQITLKPTVLDVEGGTVRRALAHLGFEGVQAVRMGKYIELELEAADREAAQQEAGEMCRKLLTNPIIEQYQVQVEERP